MHLRSRPRALGVIVYVLTVVVLAGCGEGASSGGGSQGNEAEAHREGLAIPFEGVEYNVLITRQLNVKDAEDRGYLIGNEPGPGYAAYGVFLEACNRSSEPRVAASTFRIVDSQENTYEPRILEDENVFSYDARELKAGQCIPETGSLADSAPTSGALMVFDLPLDAVENRPIELEIEQGFDLEAGGPKTEHIELDI